MKFIITPKEQWNMAKPIWRVLLLAFLVQIIGGTISLLSSPYGHPFLDFWYGGAVSTFVGYLLGAFWHQKSASSKLENHKFAFFFIGFICFGLMFVALLFPLEHMAVQMKGDMWKYLTRKGISPYGLDAHLVRAYTFSVMCRVGLFVLVLVFSSFTQNISRNSSGSVAVLKFLALANFWQNASLMFRILTGNFLATHFAFSNSVCRLVFPFSPLARLAKVSQMGSVMVLGFTKFVSNFTHNKARQTAAFGCWTRNCVARLSARRYVSRVLQ